MRQTTTHSDRTRSPSWLATREHHFRQLHDYHDAVKWVQALTLGTRQDELNMQSNEEVDRTEIPWVKPPTVDGETPSEADLRRRRTAFMSSSMKWGNHQ